MAIDLGAKRHFVGFGVGHKQTDGQVVPGLAAILFVDRKIPLRYLRLVDRLPTSIDVQGQSVPTDVVELSPMSLLGNPAANKARSRPLQGGVSISICPHRDDSCLPYGTGGALVVDQTNTHYLLSAAHVMSVQGADVIQPGKGPGGGGHNHTKKVIGHQVNGKPIYGYTAPKDNVGGVVRCAQAGIDAAIAEVIQMVSAQIGLGAPTAPVSPTIVDLPVHKSGATTGVTSGKCAVTNVTVQANAQQIISGALKKKGVPGWKAKTSVNGLFFISPGSFADGGDSGSLIMTDASTQTDKAFLQLHGITANAAVGLLIGRIDTGTSTFIIGQDITLALAALNVTLVP